jgi:DNA-binding MarR family transcriptional regulator
VIQAFAPVTLAGLAHELYLDKGQLSRTVSVLIDSGLVSHNANRHDRRQTLFELTAEGRRLHDRVLAFAIGRNLDLMGALSSREQVELFRLLAKVTATAARFYDELFDRQPAAGRKPVAKRRRSVGVSATQHAARSQDSNQQDSNREERPRARKRGS